MNILQANRLFKSYLIEVNVKQLKINNPEYVDFLDNLQKWSIAIPNKYFQWALIKKKKENIDIKEVVELIFRFEKYGTDGLMKASIVGLIDKKEVNIDYWNKKTVKDFKEFLDRLDSYNVDFNSLRTKKFERRVYNDADLVYEDERVIIWRPLEFDSSCKIGQSRWCVAVPDRSDYRDRSIEGEIFFYVIDKFINPNNNSLAFSVVIFSKEIDKINELWDYDNDLRDDKEYLKYYGPQLWKKIISKINGYGITADIRIDREEDEIWYGDEVLYDGDPQKFIDDYFVGYNFTYYDWSVYKDFMHEFISKLSGEVTDPLVASFSDDIEVTWIADNKVKLDFDDYYNNLVNGLNKDSKEYKEVTDLYHMILDEPLKYIIDGEFVTEDIEAKNLSITRKNDPNNAIGFQF